MSNNLMDVVLNSLHMNRFMRFHSKNIKKRSWYKPHEGKRQIARQQRGNHPPSIPRRMWEMEVKIDTALAGVIFLKTVSSSKRSTLARTIFAKGTAVLKPCPIILR